MEIYQATRLAQQIYPERVQAASEGPRCPFDEDEGTDRRPAAMRKAAAGWRNRLGRIANRRAQALGVEPPARPGRAVGA